ncbi:SAM-dependent methyltransferase [Saccharopolyspora terrae]|uniref:SAM-dependent methyltransferase n=1 Tax=Saccharopolyspora terrae TaxID=2530384 RepID=UPI001F3B64E9|nr:SAM-dependent methyltransferase [Saccharopolyspora terrae]
MEIDINTPQSARIWNYWLGGKDHYAVDREAGDAVIAHIPDIPEGARAERAFLVRAVRHLVKTEGLRQFLDVGTGLPTANNTHEVAQRLAPESRIVYVDNDPTVLAHARALLTSTPEGTTDYLDADMRRPEEIIEAAKRTLDFSRPIGLMMLGVVNHLMDDEEAYRVVRELVDALPEGSFFVLTHSSAEVHGEPMLRAMRETTERGGTPIRARTAAEIEDLFAGTELLEPGVVSCSQWRPDTEGATPKPVYLFGGVGRVG